MAEDRDPTTISDAAPAPKRSHKKKPAEPAAPSRAAKPKILEDLERATAPPPKPPAAGRRTAQSASLRKGLEDFPSIEVLERRLANPFGTPSEPIALRHQPEPMELRWINTELPGRYHEVTRYGGYVPVKVSELLDAKEVSDLQESPDGTVTRGERGREVLCKIPKRWYDAIQQKRAQIEIRRLQSSGRQKQDLQEAAASQSHTYRDSQGIERTISGDEAAAGVGRFFGEVVTSRETIQFHDEAQE